MKHSEGAFAPFLPSQLCSPRLRGDALLTQAIQAYQFSDFADALLAAEYVCRNYPKNSTPAILRAKILQSCLPELASKAWFRAWQTEPENPLLQDSMLSAWSDCGAFSSVLDLGPVFLPERCRINRHAALIDLLQKAKRASNARHELSLNHASLLSSDSAKRSGAMLFGACWKSEESIEGMLFGSALNFENSLPAQTTLLLCNENQRFTYTVPADGRRFKLTPPGAGVWSVSCVGLAADSTDTEQATILLQGSPLVFAAPVMKQAAPIKNAEKKLTTVFKKRSSACHDDTKKQTIDIIIPVYRDEFLVRACIASVLESLPNNSTEAQIIVIDDCSPEPSLSAFLNTLEANGQIILLKNQFNLGFIESCNRAMRVHPERDVLLLNADTLVHADWIDRLSAVLYKSNDIASVSPWSNNGEISSFPRIGDASIAPNRTQLAQIDQIAATVEQNRQQQNQYLPDIELPSCCGFTMLMRRSVIEQIGMLDGEELIRGYGEEVDWCLRARASGYRHLAATGVFVAHTGTVSFRFEKILRVRQNRQVITRRHPDFYPEYRAFIKNDPLAEARLALQTALLEHSCQWLTQASQFSLTEFSRPIPEKLPTKFTRIAVWQLLSTSGYSNKILALARQIAAQPELRLRLLVIGEATEALWHTGVVDVLPQLNWQEHILLSDSAIVGLSGCTVLLNASGKEAPCGIQQFALTKQFDALNWLESWVKSWPQKSPENTTKVIRHTRASEPKEIASL